MTDFVFSCRNFDRLQQRVGTNRDRDRMIENKHWDRYRVSQNLDFNARYISPTLPRAILSRPFSTTCESVLDVSGTAFVRRLLQETQNERPIRIYFYIAVGFSPLPPPPHTSFRPLVFVGRPRANKF